MKQLTTTQAIARQYFSDNWEQLRSYAGRVSVTYCMRRLRQYGPDQWREVRDEALSESWRYAADGEEPERAIVKAVDLITQLRQLHADQSRPLPELPAHTPEYFESEDQLRELVQALPAKLRPLAICLSADPDRPNTELAELLDCTEGTIRNRRKQLARTLGSRFGYWLMEEMDIPVSRRLT